MHRRVLVGLLGLAVLGFFIANLADHHPFSLIFADNTSTLWAWGDNDDGQIGDGTTTNKNIPTQESTGTTSWSAIAAGIGHTVALKSGGTQPTPTPIPNIWNAPSTSSWGLAALVAGMLVVMVVALGLTSGRRPAAGP